MAHSGTLKYPKEFMIGLAKGEQWFLGTTKERGVEQFVAFVNSPPIE